MCVNVKEAGSECVFRGMSVSVVTSMSIRNGSKRVTIPKHHHRACNFGALGETSSYQHG